MNVEEASQNRQHYKTTAICMSLKAVVFRLDKDIFNTILKATPTYAQLLLKASYQVETTAKSIKLMQKSNIVMLESLNKIV